MMIERIRWSEAKTHALRSTYSLIIDYLRRFQPVRTDAITTHLTGNILVAKTGAPVRQGQGLRRSKTAGARRNTES